MNNTLIDNGIICDIKLLLYQLGKQLILERKVEFLVSHSFSFNSSGRKNVASENYEYLKI